MLLTAPLLAKSSFFGSLINKCRPAVANLSLSTANNAKTIEEKVGLPPRPKKPLTPYFRYMQEMRPKLAAEYPKVSTTDLVREISKRWPTVDASLKERLQADYLRDKQQYLEQRTKYDAKLTEDQRAEIKQIKHDISEAKERRMFRKRVRSLGRPKKPLSAFLLFLAKERKEYLPTSKDTYREWHRKTTEKWSRLSEQEKEGFIQASRKELEKYKKEITAWEEQMIKQGHIDVVRQSSLIEPAEPKPKKN